MQFIELPTDDIIVATTPVKRVTDKNGKGVQFHHCIFADVDGTVKFRELSCHCRLCLETHGKSCSMVGYCGDWINCTIKPHIPYKSMTPKTKPRSNPFNPRKRRRIDSNHNDRYIYDQMYVYQYTVAKRTDSIRPFQDFQFSVKQ